MANRSYHTGHTHIDVLKIDVQGAEFDSMSTFVAPYLVNQNPLPVAQVQMQLYTWNKTLDYMLTWWGSLEDAGLRPFVTEPNLPYLNHVRGQPPELAEVTIAADRIGSGANLFSSTLSSTSRATIFSSTILKT